MAQSPSSILKINTGIIDDKKAVVNASIVAQDVVDLSAKERARILRKLDWHILPLISLLYLLAFIDRVNIGNAEIAGMATDLDLTGLRYNTAAAIFFIPYCLGQVPSNIFLKLSRPSRWLPAIMVAWGLIMTLMCLVKTYHGLLVARFFLGLAESGLFPGLAYYISLWYPRAEQAKRIALFISAAIIGGSFAGVLAYGIIRMEGIGGLHGWQWIFCLEGLITVIVAFSGFFLIVDDPETASFLTATERHYVVESLKKDSQGLATHYDFQFVLQALKDYKIYLQFIIYIGLVIPGYGIALFTPTIIKDLGFSAAKAEILSAPPFLAGCITTIFFGICSDKCKIRGPFVIGCALVGLIGYAILYTQTSPGISYFGNMLIAMGVFPCVPIELAWISSNAGGDIKRGVAIAMVDGFGNLGGICASFIFFDPPRFHVGLALIMACLCVTTLLSAVAMWDFRRINQHKALTCREHGISDDQCEEFRDLGDDSPLFKLSL